MGSSTSKVEKAFGNQFPADEKYFGFQNFGNTCYCNSVLQALYFCLPFRAEILRYSARLRAADKRTGASTAGGAAVAAGSASSGSGGAEGENILRSLCTLFDEIHGHKDRTGTVAPLRFVQQLRAENELFRSPMHQDAHEFLNYLLNEVSDILSREESDNPGGFVRSVFGGVLTNEVKCLTCETVSARDEPFLDLSLDVEQHTSISACLQSFSATERMRGPDKFFCDHCRELQEADRSMKVRVLPRVLVLHLKRFKYVEELQRHKKLCYRVVFPLQLRLRNLSVHAVNADRLYSLCAVVVHIGSGPSVGHYVTIVHSHDRWLLFDDDSVEVIPEQHLQRCFGALTSGHASDTGYMLLYEDREVTASAPLSPAPLPTALPAGAGAGRAVPGTVRAVSG